MYTLKYENLVNGYKLKIRVGRFWNFTLVEIGKGYWANIKPCET